MVERNAKSASQWNRSGQLNFDAGGAPMARQGHGKITEWDSTVDRDSEFEVSDFSDRESNSLSGPHDSMRHSSRIGRFAAHGVEQAVQRALLALAPTVQFTMLVIRRCGTNSVCVEGVVQVMDDLPDLEDVVLSVPGVERVQLRLVQATYRPFVMPRDEFMAIVG